MPVIQVVPDRFKVEEKNQLSARGSGSTTGEPHVRRPTRGIVLKDDTFATLRVVAGSGKPVVLVDAGSRRRGKKSDDDSKEEFFTINGKRATDIYSNFFIQQVNEERAEKQQILETFGEPFIFLFGERARIVTFQGVLLNTFDFNWEAEWWHNYDNYMRGTRCVENDARVFISYDETLITGYIIGSAAVKSSEQRNFVNFQFQMFVTGYTNFSKVGDPHALQGVLPQGFSDSQALSDASVAPFRPTLIDTDLKTGGFGPRSITGGNLGEFSLADGLTTNLNRISATFNSIKNQAESVIKRLSDLANGTIIRVPVGFAGALEFDPDPKAYNTTVTNGVIKYSTFDQNNDEYVGSSDHYGSSVRMNGVVRVDENINERLSQDAKMVEKAKQQWAEAGFVVPDTDSSAVSTMLVKTGFGLTAIGSNALWRSELPSTTFGLGSVSPLRVPRGPGLVEE